MEEEMSKHGITPEDWPGIQTLLIKDGYRNVCDYVNNLHRKEEVKNKLIDHLRRELQEAKDFLWAAQSAEKFRNEKKD
jgi:hypothetical protein